MYANPVTISNSSSAPRICDALSYVLHGWPVFPCSCDGEPLVADIKTASSDPAQIFAWWGDRELIPKAIGVPTGSASGIWVLEVTTPTGELTLKGLEQKYGSLPVTIEQQSARGGSRQLHLAWPQGRPSTKVRAINLGPGLSIRGEGDYVIVPPGLHAGGVCYQWVTAVLRERLPWLKFQPGY